MTESKSLFSLSREIIACKRVKFWSDSFSFKSIKKFICAYVESRSRGRKKNVRAKKKIQQNGHKQCIKFPGNNKGHKQTRDLLFSFPFSYLA